MGIADNTPDSINNPIDFNSDSWVDTIPKIKDALKQVYIHSTDGISTSSSTFEVITDMETTPDPGHYLAIFSCSLETYGVNAESEIALFVDGQAIGNTIREFRNTTTFLSLISLSTNDGTSPSMTIALCDFDGSNTLDARFRLLNGNSVQAGERSLILVKLRED